MLLQEQQHYYDDDDDDNDDGYRCGSDEVDDKLCDCNNNDKGAADEEAIKVFNNSIQIGVIFRSHI